MKIFLSYHFGEDRIVHRISYFLNKQPGIETFCWADDFPSPMDWIKIISDVLEVYDSFVFFISHQIGQSQLDELNVFIKRIQERKDKPVEKASMVFKLWDAPGSLDENPKIKECFFKLGRKADDWQNISKLPAVPSRNGDAGKFETDIAAWENAAQKCAEEILRYFTNFLWKDTDDLPIGYPFDYEKKIIEEYVHGNGMLKNRRAIQQGCSLQWPSTNRIIGEPLQTNPIPPEVTGPRRSHGSEIVVDVRTQFHHLANNREQGAGKCLLRNGLTFLEAGPREALVFPQNRNPDLRIGIVVSGGIAPGINAVIAGICQRHLQYQDHWNKNNRNYHCTFLMYIDGFAGMRLGRKKVYGPDYKDFDEQRNLGGSMISTSRYDHLLDVSDPMERQKLLHAIIKQVCIRDAVEILYIIGGEGTMRAAHAINHHAKLAGHQLSVLAIPKTMDNDILWVWQSFGFLSAVEKAKEFVMQLHTETKSNPRLCVVQLFGSDSGFVVNHTALGTGVCQAVLIPEVSYTMRSLSKEIKNKLWEKSQGGKKQSAHGIILLAETAIPSDVEDYIDNQQYEDLNLEESEKAEIRRFVGSALLCYNELWWLSPPGTDKDHAENAKPFNANVIKYNEWFKMASDEWAKLKQAVEKEFEGDRANKSLHDLHTAIAGIDADDLQQSHFKSSVVTALNAHIRSAGRFFLETNTATAEILQLNGVIEELRSWADRNASLDAYAKQVSARLRSYALQHEAREILERLNLFKYQETEDRKQLFNRLIGLVEQYRRRLLVEMAYPALIQKREKRYRRERRVFGQTPDKLRTGVLKIVSRVLEKDIRGLKDRAHSEEFREHWNGFRVFINEPRHLIRAIDPSVQDIIFGQRLGILSVDNAMAGYTDFMVSQWLTEYVLVPLKLVVLGRKRVPPTGIFWKSVLASTGQDADMW
ncbi:MAG: 6-phosphofructokinase [Acidobacteria bacterium]|nr:6-phosphofructokinase [Acidobacteriota bacterium]